MKKIIALSGVSVALFIAGFIFFVNSGANNVLADETAKGVVKERGSACPSLIKGGTCGCAKNGGNGGTCNCGSQNGGSCANNSAQKQNAEQRQATCGCQNSK